MRQTITTHLAATACCFLALSASASSDDPPLIGFWESAQTSQGGIGTALEFTDDGRFAQLAVVLVEAGYRLEDEALVFIDDAGQEQVMPIRFDAGAMKMSGPDGTELRKTRIDDPSGGESAILGAWSYDYPGQGTAFERYTEDGRMLFRLVLRAERGTYEVKGKKVRLDAPNQKALVWRFDREAEELVIGPRGDQARYRLVAGGPWYVGESP